MMIFVIVLHVIMCLVLIAIVLLQSGKGASMGAAFGGASNTIFGGAGPASFLNKVTTIAAIMFMLTSFTLALMSSRGGDSSSKVLDAVPTQQTQPVEQTETPVAEEQQDSSSEETSTSNTQEENQKPE